MYIHTGFIKNWPRLRKQARRNKQILCHKCCRKVTLKIRCRNCYAIAFSIPIPIPPMSWRCTWTFRTRAYMFHQKHIRWYWNTRQKQILAKMETIPLTKCCQKFMKADVYVATIGMYILLNEIQIVLSQKVKDIPRDFSHSQWPTYICPQNVRTQNLNVTQRVRKRYDTKKITRNSD